MLWNGSKELRTVCSQVSTDRQVIWKVEVQYFKAQIHSINEDFKKNNTRDFYKTFKQYHRIAPSLHFKNKKRDIVYNNLENCNLLTKYFDKLPELWTTN